MDHLADPTIPGLTLLNSHDQALASAQASLPASVVLPTPAPDSQPQANAPVPALLAFHQRFGATPIQGTCYVLVWFTKLMRSAVPNASNHPATRLGGSASTREDVPLNQGTSYIVPAQSPTQQDVDINDLPGWLCNLSMDDFPVDVICNLYLHRPDHGNLVAGPLPVRASNITTLAEFWDMLKRLYPYEWAYITECGRYNPRQFELTLDYNQQGIHYKDTIRFDAADDPSYETGERNYQGHLKECCRVAQRVAAKKEKDSEEKENYWKMMKKMCAQGAEEKLKKPKPERGSVYSEMKISFWPTAAAPGC